MIAAQVVADSIAPDLPGRPRLTTMVVTMPRIILAEFNTHRMLSRNSASSRAIPFKKLVESVRNNPFIPLKWMRDHSGMQGNEYLDELPASELNKHLSHNEQFRNDIKAKEILIGAWSGNNEYERPEGAALYHAITLAEELNSWGVTKQIVNRLLEPFMWHTVLVSATEWENFYNLRYDLHAEIHMQEVARVMLEAQNASTPKELKPGEWHIPFGDKLIHEKLLEAAEPQDLMHSTPEKMSIKIATALCAGVSYTVVGEDGKPLDYPKLIARHDMLAKNGHWSPFEHCAKVMTLEEYYTNVNGAIPCATDKYGIFNHEYYAHSFGKQEVFDMEEGENSNNGNRYGWYGNFRGFIQYRKMFENENRKDERLLKK